MATTDSPADGGGYIALMAILLAEPEAEAVLAAFQASQVKLISTATLV